MSIIITDLTQWSAQTQQVAKIHGLDGFPYDSWTRHFNGDQSYVEVQYLAHIGEKIFLEFLELRDPHSAKYNLEAANIASQQAVNIFDICQRIAPEKRSTTVTYVSDLKEQLEVYLSYA